MTARANITDRAKRYRAQGAVRGPRKCVICGKTGTPGRGPRGLDVMHLDGNESNGEASNLAYGCRSCNGKLAAAFKRAGIGRPTNQYNPAKKDVPTFRQYAWAVSNHEREAHDEAGVVIHATPKAKRIEYAQQIADLKRRRRGSRDDERWNPGRKNPAAASADAFEEFHGYQPNELVTVTKKVHYHKRLAAAGELVGLRVQPVSKRLPVRNIEGLGAAFLAFNEIKNQLFIEGGDQFLSDAELKKWGITSPHELETLGKLIAVGYFTDKTHLGPEGGEAVYDHKFRTTNENGRHIVVMISRYPDLIYRVRDQQFEISGGSYTIRAEGIDV